MPITRRKLFATSAAIAAVALTPAIAKVALAGVGIQKTIIEAKGLSPEDRTLIYNTGGTYWRPRENNDGFWIIGILTAEKPWIEVDIPLVEGVEGPTYRWVTTRFHRGGVWSWNMGRGELRLGMRRDGRYGDDWVSIESTLFTAVMHRENDAPDLTMLSYL